MGGLRGQVTAAELAADRARAFALTPVSRETCKRLERYVELLLCWQRTLNLVAPSTLPTLWTRHVADSLQVLDIKPHARVWIDLGSGAGFPGLVIACALAGRPGARVHLVESNQKKAAFLHQAAVITGSPVIIHCERIESFARGFPRVPDAVTARAVAPLGVLLDHCYPLLGKNGATGLFLKGRRAELELAEAKRRWRMSVSLVPSRTQPGAAIVVVGDLERRHATPYTRADSR